MGYNIEITGSGSVNELVNALRRVVDELGNEPRKEISYSSKNEKGYDDLDISVEISPDFESNEEEEDDED